MDHRRLARPIGIGLQRVHEDAVDRGDVDHFRRPLGAGRGAQRLVQRLGQEEQRLDVQVHDLVPAAFRKLVELGAPGRARIVDENVELGLALDDLGSELLAAGIGRHIDRQRDAFAVIGGGKLLCGRLAGTGLARGDVDLGAPALRNPAAIILPMPREPPVTTAIRPLSENRSLNMMPPLLCSLCETGEGGSEGRELSCRPRLARNCARGAGTHNHRCK